MPKKYVHSNMLVCIHIYKQRQKKKKEKKKKLQRNWHMTEKE